MYVSLSLSLSLSVSVSVPVSVSVSVYPCIHTHTHTQCRYGRPLGGGAAASHTDTSELDLATINQFIADMDGATATSTEGNMGDIDNDLRCHFLQYDISQEGVQKLRNAGVCRLSDFHYIQSSDVRNMNMSLLDQRKTEKMLECWHAMHQDALRGDEQQPAPPTPGIPQQPLLPADGEMEDVGAGDTFYANIPWLGGAITALDEFHNPILPPRETM